MTQVSRGKHQDLYIEGDRGAVMVNGQVIVLFPLGVALVNAAPEPGETVDVSVLVDAAVEALGDPPDGLDVEELVRRQIQDLSAHGVLTINGSGSPVASIDLVDQASVKSLHEAMTTLLTPGAERWQLPDHVSAEAFFSTVTRHRVPVQLSTGLDRLNLPEALASRLRASAANQRASCDGLITDLHRTLDALDRHGIRVLLFKGLALAAMAWGDERGRGHGDLDLLVSPDDLERTYDVLTEVGWQPRGGMPDPTSGFSWHYLKHADYELDFSLSRSSLDLHWMAHPVRSGFPDFEALWQQRTYVSIGQREVPTFSHWDALAHSASHSAKDHWRWLRGLADVHRLISQPRTWESADRPLRPDQLRTVGISAALFGVPESAPPVVRTAMAGVEQEWPAMLREQVEPERLRPASRGTRALLVRSLKPLWLARARPWDWVLYAARRGMPPQKLHTRLGQPSTRL